MRRRKKEEIPTLMRVWVQDGRLFGTGLGKELEANEGDRIRVITKQGRVLDGKLKIRSLVEIFIIERKKTHIIDTRNIDILEVRKNE